MQQTLPWILASLSLALLLARGALVVAAATTEIASTSNGVDAHCEAGLQQ